MDEKRKINVKELIKGFLPIIIFILLMLALTIIFWPYIATLGTEEGREAFKAWTDELGFGGWLVSLGIQLLQVFIAFIPGEPFEILMGFVWGPWLGGLTCLIGIFIGVLIISTLSRKLGLNFIRKMTGDDDLTKYKYLSNTSRVEMTVFLLFFMPFTPKDALNYIAPLAPIKPMKYVFIASFARIPSVFSSTLLGDRIAEGKFLGLAILFVVIGALSLVGLYFGNKYLEKKKNQQENPNNNTQNP